MLINIIFFIISLILSGIILNHNCDCNDDKDKPFDIFQIWFIFIFSLFFIDLWEVLSFLGLGLLSFVCKETIKLIFKRKKKNIKITKEDCNCKDAYKRFLG